jgi:hypothetical protein
MIRKNRMELAGESTRCIQETIIWDERGREPTRSQEIALADIVECCAAVIAGETLGKKQ